jgi:hypothetical protein
MSHEHLLTRREFTLESALAILSAATITISGCGGLDLGPSPPDGAREGVVSNNHGHRAIVTSAELNANNTIRLDLRHRATHNHELTLTAPELAAIAENGQIVKISSTTEGHSHTVTFN